VAQVSDDVAVAEISSGAVGSPVAMFLGDGPPALPGPPPIVGVHTREVLLELGFGRGEVEALRARGVVAS
jgi:hypothetical protein